jgi:hypothetical protein
MLPITPGETGPLIPQVEIIMRVAIYARVSTDDRGQDAENQLRELRVWCANAGHELVHEYVDHESGRKGVDKRRQFAALFDAAAKRKFDLVLFWALLELQIARPDERRIPPRARSIRSQEMGRAVRCRAGPLDP